jgi:hypothetical protein
MKLLIDGKLAFPPSSISCFRDVTLYSHIFGKYEVLVEAKDKHKDVVWHWLKSNGSFDYVDDIIKPGTEAGLSLSYKKRCNICVTRVTANNLNFIITRLKDHASRIDSYSVHSLLDGFSDI